jgi:hypothetical protein
MPHSHYIEEGSGHMEMFAFQWKEHYWEELLKWRVSTTVWLTPLFWTFLFEILLQTTEAYIMVYCRENMYLESQQKLLVFFLNSDVYSLSIK